MLTNHNNQILMTLSLLLFVVLSYVVSAQNLPADLQPHNQPTFRNNNNPKLSRAKRMYALCPPEFQKIGNDCFYISDRKESWLDAHFECKDRNSKLAEPLKFADRRLRKYLQNKDIKHTEKWIGGMYNYQQKIWKWGYNGGEMKYQAFDSSIENTNLQFHCTVMDPNVEYKWTARECIERHYFICQHRMSFVNEKNRQKVYAKWNETYPNQVANEVEVYVSTNGRRSNNNTYRKKPRGGMNRLSQVNNDIKKIDASSSTATTTTLPEYLPYNAYKNLENMNQKPQEDIHPLQSHVQNEDKQSLKQRKRHSLKLTGNVDLGTDMFKRKRQKLKKITQEEQSQSEIRHHNHHHHRQHPNAALPEIPEVELKPETQSTEVLTTTQVPTTSTSATTVSSSTAAPAIIEESTFSELKKKLEEKALRRERLKAKLAQLTPEERQAFLLMKQQRAEARKKGLSFATSS
ncbi:hypothetical protein PVAND_008169 [Polypedilum vanderplanki]|uniref:C-type lectin domain-containing protein n=1 Tax=Polypedilum vanderplanki TaxID=319348 RepID=A0A9J6CA56_POLVA|nr:hypothetical protein PVAND_008169 [Polypedilum vanderplanki]